MQFFVAIVVFSLFQEYIHSGVTDINLDTASIVIVKVIGIGIGSVLLAAVVCFISAFMLKVRLTVLIV